MLTSKEIIERTGISRATLNNYIGSGLVPRPQVLPPGPEHGAAPRIGYFPDDTIERIETIRRLKREGWSITRIAGHFAAREAGRLSSGAVPAPAAQREEPPPPPVPAAVLPPRQAPPAAEAGDFDAPASPPLLTPSDAAQPAYLVNAGFRLLWANEQARVSPLSPLARAAAGDNVFHHLLRLEAPAGREPLLRFHLEAAQVRGALAGELFAGLPPQESVLLQSMLRELPRPQAHPLVAQSVLPAAGPLPPRLVHAVHFRQGVLFTVAPHGLAPAASGAVPAAPVLTAVAVLAAVLQDAAGLWVRLAAEEYFELLNDIGLELGEVFRQHHGHPGRPAGEALACYFLPQPRASHLWNTLAAAHQAREAMRQVSQRWQVRKGWDIELRLNIGIDEGHDWLGTLGPAGESELRVLGDAAERAGHLSRCGRAGAILLTRNLVGKLSREERQRLTYGVPRLEGTHGEAPLLFTFARLADVAAPGAAPPGVADLPVAELLDLHAPAAPTAGGARP